MMNSTANAAMDEIVPTYLAGSEPDTQSFRQQDGDDGADSGPSDTARIMPIAVLRETP
jgi:hypothetical protein